MKHVYLLQLFLFLTVCSVQGQNLFSNPGFESGGDWWNLQVESGAATANYQSTDAHSGTYAAQINVTQAAANNYQIQLQTPSNWTAELGTTYKISFYAKSNVSATIHVAAQHGPDGAYAYKAGSDFALGTTWKLIEFTYVSDVSGAGALRFNIFTGTNVANYSFDDFVLETVGDVNLPAPVPPTLGAYYTDIYRNMFREMGKDSLAVANKVNAAYQQLFYGDPSTEAVYYETGSDMAYILDVANNDIRSEGMSYGMMIAVQLDKKAEFDKLWNFSKTYMQHKTEPRKGYFAWQVNRSTFEIIDPNSASDGEEYFAMALFFASHRWGDGTGIYNYQAEAQQLLHDMLHLETDNGGVVDGLTNMFNKTRKQIVFVPQGGSANYTDPSYHLPGFYRLWAEWAIKDNQFWADAADTSEVFLLRAMHPTTGLTTDYMTFDGQPQATSFNTNSDKFAYDSWRVIGNIAMDAHWFGNSGWHQQQTDKLLSFFNSQGPGYLALYHQDGTPLANSHASSGLVAMNGAGTLASADVLAWDFLSTFYNQAVPSGTYRYYDGLLHMLALLHSSGNFKIYKPATVTSTTPTASSSEVNLYPNPGSTVLFVECEEIESGDITVKNASGATVLQSGLTKGHARINVENLPKGVYFIQVTGNNKSIVKKAVIE